MSVLRHRSAPQISSLLIGTAFMAFDVYSAIVPVMSTMLKGLDNVLSKAAANAAERKIDPSVFLTSRLAPDMFTLTRQVQIACDHGKNALTRLTGAEPVPFEDKETTIEELQARIARVRDLLKAAKPEDFAGADTREITIQVAGREMKFNGADYVNRWALPNFYFHYVAAYSILRHNGVPVGKRDYLGA